MHIEQWTMTQLGTNASRYFCSQHVSLIGYTDTWKTLNKVDRLSLSDTDERAKVMPRLRMIDRWGAEYSIERVDNGQLIE